MQTFQVLIPIFVKLQNKAKVDFVPHNITVSYLQPKVQHVQFIGPDFDPRSLNFKV